MPKGVPYEESSHVLASNPLAGEARVFLYISFLPSPSCDTCYGLLSISF